MRRAGKQKQIQDQIDGYIAQVGKCLEIFRSTFQECCSGFDRVRLAEGSAAVHDAERKADDIRRGLEDMMYTEAVFPESRGDILGLVEAMDRVPNHAESAVRMVLIQHIEMPDEYCSRIMDLVDASYRAAIAMVTGVEQLFTNYIDATVTVGKIDHLESEADTIEEELIDKFFQSDMPDLQKILLRDLVDHISDIADRAENVGDRIRLMVAKRSI